MIYVNNKAINTTMFPDNTSQVWKLPIETYGDKVLVRWDYSYESEVMQLAQLRYLLNELEIDADLEITYLPYARQDKDISNNNTFALHVFANILNELHFDAVFIHDPHSDLALKLINNSRAIYPIAEVQKVLDFTQADLICYPDAGAYNKYAFLYDCPHTWAVKKRDQATGAITGAYLTNAETIKDNSILIVDDICDGGATFINLAKLLKEAGAAEINLFVSHGLFSKGLRPLQNAGIINIFTPKGCAYKHQEYIGYIALEDL